jgi:pyruvate,water dikinase
MLHSLKSEVQPAAEVGGKAASLMILHSHPSLSSSVPNGFALTVSFFEPWCSQVQGMEAWIKCEAGQTDVRVYEELKLAASRLPLTSDQDTALAMIREAMTAWPANLSAVRSSAPEEDDVGASYAGVFETKLGVTSDRLEGALRECFASAFDQRVFSYARANPTRRAVGASKFAAVVMEMVDSQTAGVAFSVNPATNDLDEMAVDSSWGLGESVVNGSVVADHFVWNKVESKMAEQRLGEKEKARWLCSDGGVLSKERNGSSTWIVALWMVLRRTRH